VPVFHKALPARGAVLVSLLLLLGAGGSPAVGMVDGRSTPALTLASDPRFDAGAFRVTVFADHLFYPLGMTELADGSLLVGTSEPTGGTFYDSSGALVRLTDTDGDGVADDEGAVVASGLPGAITGVERAGSLIYVVSAEPSGTRILVFRLGAVATEPLTSLGSIDFVQSVPTEHGSYALAIRPIAGQPRRHELFFNVGSVTNDAAGATVTLTGLADGMMTDASIYRLSVDDSGPGPIFSDLTPIATGLRNAAGMTFDPRSGDLLFEDNGIDTPDNPIEALSADELNRIAAGDLDGPVKDFGFPTDYVDYRTGERVGGGGLPPFVAFLPRDGDENEGASEIAVAPAAFPAGLNDGVFVGFHGQWDETGLDNEENPLLYVDLETGEVVPFVANDEPAVGHLDGLLATDEALFAADLTGTGSLASTRPTGVIYRIAVVAADRG